MRFRTAVCGLGLLVTLVAPGASAGAADLPVVKGRKVVAMVQGEPITLDELERQLGSASTSDRATAAGTLDRMINLVLLAQEAKRMGLDRLPEIRKEADAFARTALREELAEQIAKTAKADPKEVEAAYRESVREWKVSAAIFDEEEPAKAMATETAGGARFADLAAAYLANGRATKVETGTVLKRATRHPAIAQAVDALAVGATSGVVKIDAKFAVLRLDDVQYPENVEARAAAGKTVLGRKRYELVTAFDRALKKKYVTIHQDVLAGLDYEADTPGIEALEKDPRPVADVRGETPVTVADLTQELRFRFFHGTKLAAERKRLNREKEKILDAILHRKVFRKEALRRKLDRTEAYRSTVKEREYGLLFGAVVNTVVAPDVRVRDDDMKRYYAEHRTAYTSPEMVRMRSLAFAERKAAEAALDLVRKGSDFQWVADHADGRLDGTAAGILTFDGKPVLTSELPEGARKAIVGARDGDARFYAGRDDRYYVLVVDRLLGGTVRPYEEVRSEIAQKVLERELAGAVERYAAKLRSLSEVTVYLTR